MKLGNSKYRVKVEKVYGNINGGVEYGYPLQWVGIVSYKYSVIDKKTNKIFKKFSSFKGVENFFKKQR